MLIDQSGNPLTQKKCPLMCTIKILELDAEFCTVTAPQMTDLTIDVTFDGKQPECNAWFSKYLKQSCSLIKQCQNADKSHANISQYLAVSKRSLDHVESQLVDSPHFSSNLFRANFVISGCLEPFQEELWVGRTLMIGEIQFRVDALCERCQMICIDQMTGCRHKEPLSTLAKMRRTKVMFNLK